MIELKEQFVKDKEQLLDRFLQKSNSIVFETNEPVVSIILVLYNRSELTLACLQSIKENVSVPFELVIVDNCSSDRSSELLDQIEGNVVKIKNEENLGFLLACNQAVESASGEYLLFLNNDAEIHKGALESSLELIRDNSTIGAVGGKILMLDGNLQEAGCIVWKDGSCLGYGRGENPEKEEFNFQRDVDFCSGAFLLTPRDLFVRLGKFDESFAPAYYEEVDYCMSLAKEGYRIVYNPASVITHFEFASSASSEAAIELQIRNREVFKSKHRLELSKHYEYSQRNIVKARQKTSKLGRILFIEDRVPHQDLGSGYPRSNDIVNILAESGYSVTVYSINFQKEDNWKDIYRDIDPRVEFVLYYNRPGFERFSILRSDVYDIVWISRPPNMQYLKDKCSHFHETTRFVYDAEAVFSERIKNQQDKDLYDGEESYEESLQKELELYNYVDKVLTVKNDDLELFQQAGAENVEVLSVIAEGERTKSSFEDRSGILFVGNMDYDKSPNVDSILWFYDNVFKSLLKQDSTIILHLVGSAKSKLIQDLAKKNPNVKVYGRVPSLYDFYNKCRVFIAPTRFSAGIPLKVFTSASYGIPIIGSELIVRQSGFAKGESIIEGSIDEPGHFLNELSHLYSNQKKWESVREHAMNFAENNYSKSSFVSQVNRIAQELMGSTSQREENIAFSVFAEDTNPDLGSGFRKELQNMKGYIENLQQKNAELTKAVSEGHDYVTGILGQIAAKDKELQIRQEIIQGYEKSIFFRFYRFIYSTNSMIKKGFSLLGLVGRGLMVHPGKTLKNINISNFKILYRALKKEPIERIDDNVKKRIGL